MKHTRQLPGNRTAVVCLSALTTLQAPARNAETSFTAVSTIVKQDALEAVQLQRATHNVGGAPTPMQLRTFQSDARLSPVITHLHAYIRVWNLKHLFHSLLYAELPTLKIATLLDRFSASDQIIFRRVHGTAAHSSGMDVATSIWFIVVTSG